MSEIAHAAGERTTASTRRFVATLAAVLAATALFLFFDLFLAGVDRRESDAHAQAEYQAGLALLAAGHAPEADVRFGAAVATDRQNLSYGLALGEAMLAEGRTTEAAATLKALLDQSENDGGVNLAMAHVMQRENRTADAIAYFHRAIFGHWSADSTARRTQARFELIDLLARNGATRELLAELLPLSEESPDSLGLQRRLGHLFIVAGSPTRAATIFRGLLRRDPDDGDAYEGLGAATLALGNLRLARSDLDEARRLQPGDAVIARDLAIADSVEALDPTATDIGPHERYLRGRAVLARTVAALASCVRPVAAASATDSARTLLSINATGGQEEPVARAMMAVASDLWAADAGSCAVAMADRVLRILHVRLAM